MAHRAYTILGRIYSVFRIISDYISGYIFGFIFQNKHEPLPPIKNSILLESAFGLAEKIRTRKLKSEDVVKVFIDRIREVNILINAMVDQRFVEAILEAQKADALIASGTKSEEQLAQEFPLLGVPYTTKECMNVKGLRQTGGLVSRKTFVSDFDAPVVQKMADSGAILLGVCNTSELISWLESYNCVYGRTNNSYDTTRTSGGSTGGDGSLISCCGSVLAIGTDIGGSIRVPSMFNGIFGHKPTAGCVSLEGMLPPNSGELLFYNNIGPMSRNATDLAPALKCILQSKNIAEKLNLDQSIDLRGIKIFYQEDDGGNPFFTPTDVEIRNVMRKALMHFEKIYGVKAVKLNLKELYHAIKIYGCKIKSNAPVTFSTLLGNNKTEVNGVVEFIKWLFRCSDHTLPAIMLSMYEKVMNDDPDFVQDMDSKLTTLRNELVHLLGHNGVFFYPTQPTPAPYHYESILRPLNFVYTGIVNVLGLPATHCPMGLNSNGLPIGFQVIANSYEDRLTIAVAKEIQRAFGGWVPPCAVQI